MKAENKFTIYFDGGYTGRCYGSWQVQHNGFSKTVSRRDFNCFQLRETRHATSNVAEYLALLDALKWMESVRDKSRYVLDIYTDSQLLQNTVSLFWKSHKPHIQALRDLTRNKLNAFGKWTVSWRPRERNVERFGH